MKLSGTSDRCTKSTSVAGVLSCLSLLSSLSAFSHSLSELDSFLFFSFLDFSSLLCFLRFPDEAEDLVFNDGLRIWYSGATLRFFLIFSVVGFASLDFDLEDIHRCCQCVLRAFEFASRSPKGCFQNLGNT